MMRITRSYQDFNDSQRHALDGARNLAVRANAGSGKTSVLVERMVQLLAATWDDKAPLSITALVALTFTRKAAAELQDRLRGRFQEMANAATESREQDYWKEQIDELPRAMIGTIDSFCSKLLREFGFLDASPQRLEPDFEPLDEYETGVLKRDAIDRVINRFSPKAERPDSPEAEACLWWANEEGYDALVRHLRTLLDHLVDPALIVAAHQGMAPADQRVAGAWAGLPAVQQLRQDREQLRQQLQGILDTIAEQGDSAKDTLLNRQADVVAAVENLPGDNPTQERAVFKSLRAVLLTGAGKSRSMRGLSAVADVLEPLQETWQPLLVDFDFDEEAERHALQAADHLATLLAPVHAEYMRLCAEANRVDFTTLERRARDLLQLPDVCRKLKERFRYVMVDEFQDTNQLQWEIIARLVGEGPDGMLDRDRLFIVGDPQQSIYRFRQADVGVFRRVQERIETSNRHHGHADRPTAYDLQKPKQMSSAEQRVGLMPLGENYRSLTPTPLEVMNRVFTSVFSDGRLQTEPARYAFEVDYQPLIAGLKGKGTGEIRYLVLSEAEPDDDGEEGTDEESAAAEGLNPLQVRAVVDQLVEFHGQPKIVPPRDRPEATTLGWRDMAILLPSRTMTLTQLENELRDRGVPFIVTGGIGFWQRQEIRDLVNLASFLADRGDELSLFAVLRGPLGQCTDAEILFLSQLGLGSLWRGLRFLMPERDTLAPPTADPAKGDWPQQHWQRLPERVQGAVNEYWTGCPAKKQQRLRETARLLATWRQRTDRMAHADLLQRAVEESGAYALYAAEADGDVSLANLERLFDRVRNMEARSAPDMNRLARTLRELRDDVEKEQQATLARDTDAVQIMTVHAAKGLEFPVVAVMKLERKADRGGRASLMVKSPWDELLACDAAGFGHVKPGTIAVSVRHPVNPRGKRYAPQLLEALRGLDSAQELAESKRLFYVAATRAQERLIFAGKQPAPRKDGSPGHMPVCWQHWFEQALGLSEAHKQAGLWENPETGEQVRIVTRLTGARPSLAPAPVPPPADVDLAYIHERPLHPVVATTGLDEMRELWRTDRGRWWLRYRLQLLRQVPTPSSYIDRRAGEPVPPAQGRRLAETPVEDDTPGIGAVVGSMVHRLFEMPTATVNEPPGKLRPLLEAMAGNLLTASDMADRDDDEAQPRQVSLIVASVEQILERIRKQPGHAKQMIDLLKAKGEVETPFALRFSRWIVSGRFDKLLSVDKGYEVVDWKTDADADPRIIVERHRPQMKLYALALLRTGLAAVVDGQVRVHLALLKHLRVETLHFTPAELDVFEAELASELDEMTAFASR